MKRIVILFILVLFSSVVFADPKPKTRFFEKKVLPSIIKTGFLVSVGTLYNGIRKDKPVIASGMMMVSVTAIIRIK